MNCPYVRKADDDIISLDQFLQPDLDIDTIDIFDVVTIKERYQRFLSLINNPEDDEGNFVHSGG